ncbi:MAG: UDP-N-acetylmuramate dehydrogenase [Methylococcales bacterium]|nr:UDP-N-acetylmuramate dehydrogenase [Methylococcales bacterium]
MNERLETTGKLLLNEKMAKYTSWRVGGNAEKMYFPHDKDDLINFIRKLPQDSAIFWLGLGSNLLVRDGGISGVVINTRGRLKKMYLLDEGRIYVESGVPCARVARFCVDNGLMGAEFLAGIPGTMGGALKMNAGAFGSETWEIVARTEMLNRDGVTSWRKADEFEVSYRTVKNLKDSWFLATELQLNPGDTSNSLENIKGFMENRSATQPINLPSCGSVFKNPEGDYAARLIEKTGLKGYCIGGACVSEKHANFIVNIEHATAANIEALIDYVQCQVELEQGIRLQTEVCKVGVSL